MACGKAVILTRTEGLWDEENMRHLDTCYLVDPGDRDAIETAIEYFESNPDEVERIGRNARETVLKHYTTPQFAGRLEELLVSTTSKRGSITDARL
jgi:glycosyltransferase involved in cell wall biosynthesis